MSQKFIIYTDSTTDLPASLVKELDLKIVNLTYEIKNKVYTNYLDYRQQPVKEFYDLVRKGNLATTSQVNPEQYLELLTPDLDAGNDILILSFSSKLSGTYNSGRIAAEELREKYPNQRIEIIDTKSASLGEGFLVRLAALKRNSGASLDETISYVKDQMPHIAHWFTVDDINHLRRGGRIGAVSSFVAKALNIKPVMHTNDEGSLIPRTKARGRKKAIKGMFKKMQETALENQEVVMIGHGDSLDDAKYLESLIKTEYGNDVEVIINFIGPVIGAHTGQGVLALFFLAEHR